MVEVHIIVCKKIGIGVFHFLLPVLLADNLLYYAILGLANKSRYGCGNGSAVRQGE